MRARCEGLAIVARHCSQRKALQDFYVSALFRSNRQEGICQPEARSLDHDEMSAEPSGKLSPYLVEGLSDGIRGIGPKCCTVYQLPCYQLTSVHSECPEPEAPLAATLANGLWTVNRVQ